MEDFSWIKIEAIKNQLTLKFIASKSGFGYDKFLKIVNQFRKAPDGFTEKVKSVIDQYKK